MRIIYAYIHACIHTYIHIQTRLHTYARALEDEIHIHTYIYIQTYRHIYIQTYRHAYIYTDIQTYIFTDIHIYTDMPALAGFVRVHEASIQAALDASMQAALLHPRPPAGQPSPHTTIFVYVNVG